MKKLIALAFLSAAGLVGTAAQAPAWYCCQSCCNKCCTTICVQPYNAFTPACCGSVTCNGCCPLSCGGCGQSSWGGGAAACGPYGCGQAYSEGGNGVGAVGQLPMLDGGHAGASAAYSGPIYQAPGMPAPAMQGPSLPAPTFQGPMPGPVPQNNAVGYGPGYYPGYPGMTPGATSMNTFLAPGSR